MIRLYTLLWYLLIPLILLRLCVRGLRNREYWRRWPERFGFITPPNAQRMIWIHAVSVGEARAARPVVKSLRRESTDNDIIITSKKPTGSGPIKTFSRPRPTDGGDYYGNGNLADDLRPMQKKLDTDYYRQCAAVGKIDAALY